MEWATLSVSLIGLMLALSLRPAYSLSAYLAVLFLYPQYLRVSLGTIDISASRIVITALLLRCLLDYKLVHRFRWKRIDTYVVISVGVYTVSTLINTPFEIAVENRGGFLMDALFVYLATRWIVVDRSSFTAVAKTLALIIVPLALVGAVESLTGLAPFAALHEYCPWAPKALTTLERQGIYRAMGPDSHPIMFGMGFAIVLPIVWVLRHERGAWGASCYAVTVGAVIGVLSSVSSGPYLQLGVVAVALVLERYKNLVRPLLAVILLGCITMGLMSNRRIWYILAEMAFDAENGWYRARLIDVALEKLPEYWAFGYGLSTDPGWGPDIVGLPNTDIVNEYVLTAVQHGCAGVLMLFVVLAASLLGLYRTYRSTTDPWLHSATWAVGASLVGVLVLFWTVSIHEPMILYFLLGLAGALAAPARPRAAREIQCFGRLPGRERLPCAP